MDTEGKGRYKIVNNKGICFPEGFLAAGIHCGIKESMQEDLGVIYCEKDAVAACVFTQNSIKAAPVVLSNKLIEKTAIKRAVVVNSGCANACTGMKGLEDAKEMVKLTAKSLNIGEDKVLICSTGVIGEFLPMDKVRNGIEEVCKRLGKEDLAFSKSIMTTDTKPKMLAIETDEFRLGGCCKGAGMIHPNMATMLAFITTDVEIDAPTLKHMLKKAVDLTFNRISVDGDTSTNDTVIIMSKTGNKLKDYDTFEKALIALCHELALMILKDGEGVTKVVKINVKNAKTLDDAKKIAQSISKSLLFKTALFGEDPNWGRIVAATGYSGAEVIPELLEVYFEDILLAKGSMLYGSEEDAKNIMKKPYFEITVNLNLGKSEYYYYTTDISYEYVKINAEYKT